MNTVKAQQGTVIKRWVDEYKNKNPTVTKDNTNVSKRTILPETVDNNEVMREYLKIEKRPQRIEEVKKLLLKYGNPSMSFGNKLFVSGAHTYNAFTNNMMINNDVKGKPDMIENGILEELAHAKQRQDQGALKMTGRAIKDFPKRLMNTNYTTPGALEHEAHSVISPKFKSQVDSAYWESYPKQLESWNEWEPEDPDRPAKPVKKLSKLDQLKLDYKKKANP